MTRSFDLGVVTVTVILNSEERGDSESIVPIVSAVVKVSWKERRLLLADS